MISFKKNFVFLFLFLPFFMLAQDQIWYKTQKEVTELLFGEWKTKSYTFEGKEKKIDPKNTFGLLINRFNDSLKVSELSYYYKKIRIIDFNLNFNLDKVKSEYFFCIDYKYKDFCYKIKVIDSTTLILEEGPNISTLRKVEN